MLDQVGFEPVGASKLIPPVDVRVVSPAEGVIRVESALLFTKADGHHCRRFLERVFLAPEIHGASIAASAKPYADLHFDAKRHQRRDVLRRLATLLKEGGAKHGPGREKLAIAPAITARDQQGVVRYRQYENLVTGWQVVNNQPGTIKLKNPVLFRKAVLCQAIERELMSVLGIDRYETSPLRCWVHVEYDPRQLGPTQIIEILDTALANTEHPLELDKVNLDLAISTVSVPLAATAQFAMPALLPVAAAVFVYTAIPSFRGAYRVLFKERRLGVDLLDSIVVLGCLATTQILPGAVLVVSLAFGRFLVRRTEDNSKRMLLGVFGKQARYVWLLKDGAEIQLPLDRLQSGDVVVVSTGEVVPVDGIIVAGLAMVDQHALTGEATPAEKGVGDRVFASTVMVAGKMHVQVEKSGSATASAKIAQILQDTAGHKLASQHRGERLADMAVIPTLAIGAVALAAMGPPGAVAVINSDFGTGIRMAAPLAMLSTLSLCAQKGVLVKDGRALDILCEIDTVIFDKTGTLTRERPEIGRIVAANGFSPAQILAFAAAAEQRFHHPIALAILDKAADQRLQLPATDETQYRVGYGITVGVDGRRIRVGSRRFMESEGVALSPEIETALAEAHDEGHTMVMVAVDDEIGGALELQAAVRPEVRGIVQGLRDRGIKHVAIISGDHEAPTRKLAQELGMDRYFAQVMPADKAEFVEKLRREGRKVCFVGDGINDAIALKKANVGISLRGATMIATDTAQIVFMEQSLGKLCELLDIAHALKRNVRNSWVMIIVPNVTCIAGVFTMGFGIAASVVTNNVAGLGALANGIWPMRKVAQLEAERRHLRELRLH